MAFWLQDNFRGGLNTDDRFAANTVSQCQDMILGSDGELRMRHPLTTVATLANAGYDSLNAFLFADSNTQGGHLVSVESGGTYTLHRAALSSSSYSSVGSSFVWDNVSTAFTTNNITLPANPSWTTGNKECFFLASHDGGTKYTALRWSGGASTTYATGTCSGSAGDNYVTGSGTTWNDTNLDVGQYFIPPTADEPYRILGFPDTTTLVLDRPLDTTISAASSYKIQNLAPVCTPDLTDWKQTSNLENAISLSSFTQLCYHQNRLFASAPFEKKVTVGAADYMQVKFDRVRWSATPSESHATISWATGADYWTDNAAVNVGAGVGGRITKMLSLSNTELLILKNGATFILRGSLATDGTDLGAQVDTVSGERGGIDAALTRLGPIILAEDDVYLLSGGGLQSMVDGSVRAQLEAATYTNISAVGNLVVISGNVTEPLVFDIPTRTWSTIQLTTATSPIVLCTANTGGSNTYYSLTEGGYIQNWTRMQKKSANNRDADQNEASYPVPLVRTQPIPLGYGDGIDSRPNSVFVDYYLQDASASNPTMTVKAISGRSGSETSTTLEYSLSENSADGRVRCPINGIGDTSHIIIEVSLDSANTARDFVLYGIGVEYRGVNER